MSLTFFYLQKSDAQIEMDFHFAFPLQKSQVENGSIRLVTKFELSISQGQYVMLLL